MEEELAAGLYEALVTEGLDRRLHGLDDDFRDTSDLRAAEAADRIAWHVGQQIERALRDVPDEQRPQVGARLARRVLDLVGDAIAVDPDDRPLADATMLRAVHRRRLDGRPHPVASPLTPLLDSTLLTGAPGEPTLLSEINSEIESADSVDLVMAFVRRSGINPLIGALRRHCGAGRPLRVLTTTYTGSTEKRALDLLSEIGADVRVSYDLTTTRLHAKAWMFHRHSGFGTAYVGSSNLTHSAQVTGLEWNVRIAAARQRGIVEKFGAVFDSYWASDAFVPYDPVQFEEETRRSSASDGPRVILSPVELRAEPFQARLLELITVARESGRHRNLLVSATGTGKTVMAALDYADLRESLTRARLLFVAHRQEILDQSMATFRYALRDPTFGEKWVAGHRPSTFDHVFASIQSLHAADLDALPPDHFDVVIVDEFHHAAAASYERILDHLTPRELLGLTATPERSDGLPILHWFDGEVSAELRLWDAIEQQHLCPFHYFGVHDGLDLREVPWRRGHGYDVSDLTNLYTGSQAWARLVIKEFDRHVDIGSVRALGFCVSVAHAEFMADHFRQSGIPAVAISGTTPTVDREAALQDLRAGRVRVVFSVDIFNEGVDVPDVDAILMLRPTESPTVFLQQLGRGLRKAPNKGHCVVLDFVGTHRKEFRFDRRFRALLGGTRRDVERAVKDGFPFLPSGCHMQLDEQAATVVLQSLKDAIPTRWKAKVDELRSLAVEGGDVSLGSFMHESGLDLDDIYAGKRGWSDLREAAGLTVDEAGPSEAGLRRAVGRLLHVDDRERVTRYRELLDASTAPRVDALSARDQRLLHMLAASVGDQALRADDSTQDAVDLLWQHPQVRHEIRELLDQLAPRIDHVHSPLTSHPDTPLQVHARYTRIEILAACGLGGEGKIPAWQSGVYEAKAPVDAELFAFTLDKTSGGFSPTTRYRDFAISRTRIHWESQSATRADSPTGLRYRHHERDGRSIFLFTRLRTVDRAFWFLGPARYRGHVGEKPMAITWELDHPLSGDMFAAFGAAVA